MQNPLRNALKRALGAQALKEADMVLRHQAWAPHADEYLPEVEESEESQGELERRHRPHRTSGHGFIRTESQVTTPSYAWIGGA